MNIPLIHGVWTGLLILVFIGVLVWVYGVRSKAHFDEAARLPLDDDEAEAELAAQQAHHGGANSAQSAAQGAAKNAAKSAAVKEN